MEEYGEWVELVEAAKVWLVSEFESLIALLAAIAEDDNRTDVEQTGRGL